MVKPSPWGGHQGNGWGSGGMSWGRDHRRGSGMGVPGSVSHASPLKKPFSSNVIAPPKFPRSGGSLGPKSWLEENMFRTDSNSNTLLPLQVNVLGCYCVNWCWWCCRIIVLCFVFASGWVWGVFFFFCLFFLVRSSWLYIRELNLREPNHLLQKENKREWWGGVWERTQSRSLDEVETKRDFRETESWGFCRHT